MINQSHASEVRIVTGELGAYEKRKTLKDVITDCIAALRDFHEDAWSGDSFEECFRKTSEAIENQLLDSETMSEEWTAYAVGQDPDPFSTPFKHSLIYSLLAQRASVDGKPDVAWPLVSKASRLLGLAEGAYSRSEPSASEVRRQMAKKGGSTKNEKHVGRVKKEAIRLLIDRRPPEGWDDTKAAVEAIEKDLTSFVKDNKIALVEFNLKKNIGKWINGDPLVSAAFKGEIVSIND